MTQNKKTQDIPELNFTEFQQDAAKRIKAGQPLTGKGGILTPLILGTPQNFYELKINILNERISIKNSKLIIFLIMKFHF